MNDRPISELISSLDNNSAEEKVTPKKQNKAFLIIVSILLVLIACVGAYYVYTQYVAKEEVEEEQEQEQEEEEETTKDLDDVEIVLNDKSKIYVKMGNSGCDDTGFVQVHNSEYSIWEDNQNGFCSSSYIIGYFPSKDIMSKYYVSTTQAPSLQKITVAGTEYEYIKKVNGIKEQDGVGMGIAYKWEPEITVKEYKASSIVSYYNPYELSSDLKDSSIVTTYCLLDLSKLFDGVEGYLVFNGVADVYSDVDYCSILNEMDTFSITK